MTDPDFRANVGTVVVVGLSHHTAPIEVRERLAITPVDWYAAPAPSIPSVLLTTCNRVEAYAWTDGRPDVAVRRLEARLARVGGLPLAEIEPYLFTKTGTEALLHLVRVAAGLDSLVVGERQIRGQLADAYWAARAAGARPAVLGGVVHHALQAGRRVRAGVSFADHPSVAAAALAAIRDTTEPRSGSQAVVLGAGAMARAAAQEILQRGARVVLVNRTIEHARTVAAALGPGATAAGFDALPDLLVEASLIVTATAARQPVLDRPTFERVLARRAGPPPIVLDIALPRDVAAEVRTLPGMRLVDLDDLERLGTPALERRRREIDRAEARARQEAALIDEWLRVRRAVPSIVALRQYGEQVRAEEIRRHAARLDSLTPAQREAVEALTGAIVNKLLHGPTVALRERAREAAPPDPRVLGWPPVADRRRRGRSA